MSTCAIVSFRLNGSDGVSVVANGWQAALRTLGWQTYTVAGDGPVDLVVPGFQLGASEAPTMTSTEAALADADLVLVENMLSIPMNLPASRILASVLKNRPALLHHHDPPWQRERFAHITELPPTDPRWVHVTINRYTEEQFASRGIEATTIYNGFDQNPPTGDRTKTRQLLGLDDDQLLFAHPVRAIARKNVPVAMDIAAQLGAVYWLPGAPEEDYAPTLEALIADANQLQILRTKVGVQPSGETITMADLYAACDLVLFPSLWEGFGNPPIEAALHHRLAAVGDYPVAAELRELGFQWLEPKEPEAIRLAIKDGAPAILDSNRRLAKRHLSLEGMTEQLGLLLAESGWQL